MLRFALVLASVICTQILPVVQATAQENQAPPVAVTVELIEAGKAPLRELRFTPQKGSTQTSAMTMGMDQTMTVGAQKLPTQIVPKTKIFIKTTVGNVSANGNIELEFSYTNIEVVDDPANPSPAAEVMRGTLKPMIGMSGSVLITNRGFTQEVKINIPEGVSEQLKQLLEGMKNSMSQMSSPLPAEPVGVGGKWRVVQNVDANGLKIKQTSEHEITELNQDGFSVNVTVIQNAEPQEVKNKAIPPGTKLNLKSLTSTGNGTSTFDSGSIFPVRTTMTTTSQTAMLVEAAGQKQDMTTDVKMDLTLEQLP
jgi:Family of unknown function (DUF6263)